MCRRHIAIAIKIAIAITVFRLQRRWEESSDSPCTHAVSAMRSFLAALQRHIKNDNFLKFPYPIKNTLELMVALTVFI